MGDRCHDPEEYYEACDDVCFCPPRGSKWTNADIGNLSPIEGNETHSETTLVTEQLVDDDVLWSDPAHPGEVAERLEKITWEEVPTKTPEPDVCEESPTRETRTGAHTSIYLGMQSIEERAVNQIRGPD